MKFSTSGRSLLSRSGALSALLFGGQMASAIELNLQDPSEYYRAWSLTTKGG